MLGPLASLRTGLAGIGALAYVGSSLFSAFFSEDPASALPGSYLRQAGLFTDLALLGLFFAAARAAKNPRLASVLGDGLLAGAAVTALLAIIQTLARPLGLDVPFLEPGSRATSLSGGPTYLGSHLAALLPYAVARTRTRWGALWTLLIAAGLLLSGSRVALIAAAIGVIIVIFMSEQKRRRALVTWAGGLLLLLGVVCIGPVRELLPADSLPNRIFSEHLSQQLEVRGLLYRDALSALGNQPHKLLIGRGPDAIGPLFTREISEDLQRQLGGQVRVDRFHSDPIDLVYTRGLLALLSVVLLLVGALTASRKLLKTTLDPGERTLAIGLGAGLVVIFFDGCLSVPAAVSRMMLFVGAGWLASRSCAGGAELELDEPRGRGLLLGTALATGLFSLAQPSVAWLSLLPLLILVPRESVARATGPMLLLFVPFLVVHIWLDPAGAVAWESISPETSALRAGLDTVLLVILVGTAVTILASRMLRDPNAHPGDRPVRYVLALVTLLLLASLSFDDTRRLMADVDARAAYAADRAAKRPDLAARLLERASTLSPAVPDYRTRSAFALADEARLGDEEDNLHLLLRAGHQVGRVVENNSVDGWQLARGAGCILVFSRLLEDQSHGLLEQAWTLSEQSLDRAPTACPILQIAGEIQIERGNPTEGWELLDRAIAIDASPMRSWLLRGRAEAALHNIVGAAHDYGEANLRAAVVEDSSGEYLPGRQEALAGLALAATASGNQEDAATLILRLADRAHLSHDLKNDVNGARPLLLFIPYHDFAALFEKARKRYRGNPEHLDLVEEALTY